MTDLTIAGRHDEVVKAPISTRGSMITWGFAGGFDMASFASLAPPPLRVPLQTANDLQHNTPFTYIGEDFTWARRLDS